MASTNNAFRGMDGADALFKSKAELKAEKAAAKEKKKLEKSKVRDFKAFSWLVVAVPATSCQEQRRQAADTVAALWERIWAPFQCSSLDLRCYNRYTYLQRRVLQPHHLLFT
jgi:hypothetical protein